MPGPVVVDQDLDVVLAPPHANPDRLVRRREGAGILDQVGEHLAEPAVVADHEIGVAAAAGSTFSSIAGSPGVAALVGDRRPPPEQLRHVDRFRIVARQLRIEPRGVGNVGDQPVEPAHVVLDDLHQPAARIRRSWRAAASRRRCAARSAGSSARARRRRRSSRSPRCGRRARWSCRAAPPTDCRSRPAVGEIGDLLAALDAAPHPLGGRGQPAQRIGDGRGEQHRQDDHDQRRDPEDAQDAPCAPPRRSCRCRRLASTAAARRARRAKRWTGTATETICSPARVMRTTVGGHAGQRADDLGIGASRCRPAAPRRPADRCGGTGRRRILPGPLEEARAPRPRSAAGRSAGSGRANRGAANRAQMRRGHRCGRACGSARSAAAAAARRAPD